MADTFTILPKDRPFQGFCSRCGSVIGKKLTVAEWNQVRFGYCEPCALKAEAPKAVAA